MTQCRHWHCCFSWICKQFK